MFLKINGQFESSVNSEYSKTTGRKFFNPIPFESSVNSEYSKTGINVLMAGNGLRVV